MNKLFEEGYEPVLGSRALSVLNRDLGHGIAGKKHTFDAPKDYTPGRNDDMSKGYHKGSLIINQRREVFMCVDEAEGQANWIILGSLEDMATKGSYVRSEPEDVAPVAEAANGQPAQQPPDQPPAPESPAEDQPEEPAQDPDPVGATHDEAADPIEGEAEQTRQEHLTKDSSDEDLLMGAQSGPERGQSPIPDDMPWASMLKKAGLEYIEDVQKAIDQGTLADKPWMNADRAASVKDWLAG